jgi:hypothetical protein
VFVLGNTSLEPPQVSIQHMSSRKKYKDRTANGRVLAVLKQRPVVLVLLAASTSDSVCLMGTCSGSSNAFPSMNPMKKLVPRSAWRSILALDMQAVGQRGEE